MVQAVDGLLHLHRKLGAPLHERLETSIRKTRLVALIGILVALAHDVVELRILLEIVARAAVERVENGRALLEVSLLEVDGAAPGERLGSLCELEGVAIVLT